MRDYQPQYDHERWMAAGWVNIWQNKNVCSQWVSIRVLVCRQQSRRADQMPHYNQWLKDSVQCRRMGLPLAIWYRKKDTDVWLWGDFQGQHKINGCFWRRVESFRFRRVRIVQRILNSTKLFTQRAYIRPCQRQTQDNVCPGIPRVRLQPDSDFQGPTGHLRKFRLGKINPNYRPPGV